MTTPATPGLPHDQVAYPDAPWAMLGSMWLSVFRLKNGVDELRPAGIYGAAFVSYTEGSPLTYSELLVARLLRKDEGKGRKITITDIWVDSPASVAGGRELWAIPKGLCDFELDSSHRGPLTSTDWSASLGRTPIASASFTDVSRIAPRVPFKQDTYQPELPEGGGEKGALMKGSAKALPGRAHWDFAADGALGYLRGATQLTTLRLSDFRLSFG
ncbi:acetoacetate decarboxylase family protein [soil metagenome]